MGMKSIAYATAIMAAGMMMGGTQQVRRSPMSRRYKEASRPFIFPKENNVPKGHVHEYLTFQFELNGHNIIVEKVLVSGGTLKSYHKNIKTIQGELANYLRETGIQDLIKFAQFQIIEIKKEEPIITTPSIENLKGALNGNCNRTACQKPRAVYYNHSTQKHYCPTCAKMINEVNHQRCNTYVRT